MRKNNDLKEIYFTPIDKMTAEDISNFKKILQRTKVNPGRCLTNCGDTVADRGTLDYFTLLLFKHLHEGGVSIEQMDLPISNHDLEFIADYRNKRFTGETDFPQEYAHNFQSLKNMVTLIKKGIIDEQEVRDIVEQHYRPMLKAISYTLSPDRKHITLFTHAPVGLADIARIAQMLYIRYNDDTVDSLMHTIDCINQRVQAAFDKDLVELCEDGPLHNLISNRKHHPHLAQKPASNNYSVEFVHGHVNVLSTQSPIHCNLDNVFGKSEDYIKAPFATRRSNDLCGAACYMEKEEKEERAIQPRFLAPSLPAQPQKRKKEVTDENIPPPPNLKKAKVFNMQKK